MKKIFPLLMLVISFSVFPQTNKVNRRENIDRQIEEIMKAREEMIRSLLDDSAFSNFDSHFDDLVKKFEQDSFGGMPGAQMDMGAVVGEYDWRETDTHQILVLKVKQIKDRPLDIKIEKGEIKLKGDVESVSEDKSRKRKQVSKVHFERSFSIPEGVDQSTPEFENKGGELLIKFKKLNVSKAPSKINKKESIDQRRPIGKDADDVTI